MKKKKEEKSLPKLSTEKLRAFCRFEGVPALPDYFEGEYAMTLEDLRRALENILAKNATVKELYNDWFDPIDCHRLQFSLICSEDEEKSPTLSVRFLPLDEHSLLLRLWISLGYYLDETEEWEANAVTAQFLSGTLNRIHAFWEDLELPVEQRRYSSEEKSFYISNFRNENEQENAEEYELWLCRRFTEQLCEEGNIPALELKGWSCYGGNRLYPCDWYAARDCMETLLAKTGNGNYANTLGYIYYYGRCNDGVPEYEKAFEKFGIGAAAGYFESSYKLADCYARGYGCVKSPVTAKLIYQHTYDKCLQRFMQNQPNTLADAALRMGRVYLEGIAAEVNPQDALYYLLQARYAQNLRMAERGFYGSTSVTENIENAITEAKKLLRENYLVPYYNYPFGLLYGFMQRVSLAEVSVEPCQDGSALLRVCGLAKDGKSPQAVLLTEPPLEYCERTATLSFTAFHATWSKKLKQDPIRIDYFRCNDEKQRLEFYRKGERRGWIAYEELRFYGNKGQNGEKLTLVSVTFSPYGKSYDYLCTLNDVKVGERVVVPTQSGEAVVTVVRCFEALRTELRLPFDRYKSVLRKESEGN